jgi:hypothetical protein
MKIIILAICCITGIGAPVFSWEAQCPPDTESVDTAPPVAAKGSESPRGSMTADVFVSVTWPSVIDITDSIAVNRFAFGFGLGYHFNIINKILSPGLYFDFGFGGPIIIFKNGSSDQAVAYDGYGSVGLRAYNLFTVAQFGLKPFFGFSFIGNTEIKQNGKITGEGFGLWSWITGVIVTYKYGGFEYAFCVPDFNTVTPFPYKYYHRISLLLHAS